MNQYEVPALIADELPEVENELHFLAALGNVNDAMTIPAPLYTAYIRQVMRSGC